MLQIPWAGVYEIVFTAATLMANPTTDATVQVRFLSPAGQEQIREAFWDGGQTWRVRFSPEEVGQWRWQTTCSLPADEGLHGQSGAFECVANRSPLALYRHGSPQLSHNRRYLVHRDGTPLLWLSDTAWNGPLRSRAEDWERYLQTRARQGFTAIQFVSTQWRACSRGIGGELAYSTQNGFRINPEFFQQLDPKVRAINEHGLLAVPVIMWAIGQGDPGYDLPEEAAVRLARYIVARWGAYQVVWMLAGDGNYQGQRADRWRRIGRRVFDSSTDRLATMHPGGLMWVVKEFNEEPWLSFHGYQSGHGAGEKDLRWHTGGPPGQPWLTEPVRPVINLEPNYEAHPAYGTKVPFDDRLVRRALYWSLMLTPTAGVSYGHNSIWPWSEVPEVPENHRNIGVMPPWHHGLETPGLQSVQIMQQFFRRLPWWQLQPAQHLLASQPGQTDLKRFVTAAATPNGGLALVYLPVGGTLELRSGLLSATEAHWFNPRTGAMQPAGTPAGESWRIMAPSEEDWLLVIGDPKL